ncbi:hypothetical protein DYB25_000632 [Aphanomyces astaci]|uniref:Myb-like domain-containing protein n=1 Tax=Aphanomyces astaci TaxID=112090 RepID=A0A397DHZ0_APHAT|nr:hypothetical protein DYB25_000632 [Aphanomyces astaci]RHY36004.1 hypothetical protein DYB38_000439 [Aphanomyces astaci]RHY62633.1 hypothetical protein DYB30_000420 [Aphanomyces astaci]RHY65330.1 hypothetical protein DYB34_000569 [Aphanomyces astaci]RHY80212.1 hypothetical protein DYB26_000475 [Aphanomyces astaci]
MPQRGSGGVISQVVGFALGKPYRSPKPTPSPPATSCFNLKPMMDDDESSKHEQLHAVNAAAQLYHVQLAQQQQLQQLQHTQSLGASVVAQQLSAAAASANFPYPRNSPDFACENVGDRIKGKRRKYCPHEVTALVLGVQRYADDSCPWSSILRDPHLGPLFHGRSGVDLKDKWRTLIKTRPELSSYTENRKNHRKYRPFTTMEERALIDGVKKYNGQRNVWSLILVDKDLGVQFNDRSNVQLKDKFRTLRRSGVANTITLTNPSNRKSALPTSNTTSLRPGGGGIAGGGGAASASGKGGSLLRAPLSPKSRAQLNAAALANPLLHSQSMFTDPNLFLTAQLSLGQIGHLTLAQAQVQAQLQQQAQAAQAKTFSQMLAAANSSYNNALPAFMIGGGNTSPQSNLFYAVSSPSATTGHGTSSGTPSSTVPFQAMRGGTSNAGRGATSGSGRMGRLATASSASGGRRGRGKAKATSIQTVASVLDNNTPGLENTPLSPPLEGLIPMPAAVRGKLDDSSGGWDPIDEVDDQDDDE